LREGRLIVLWMTADEFERAAIAVGGSAALVTLLVHETEVLPAVGGGPVTTFAVVPVGYAAKG
jgi:hypothetical protein